MKLTTPKAAAFLLEVGSIGACAVLGVLMRLQLAALSHANIANSLGASFFYANVAGTAFLAALVASLPDDLLRVSLCTGLCGALTTFSAWMVSVSNALIDGRIDDALLLLFVNLACVMVAYRCGVVVSQLFGSSVLPLLLLTALGVLGSIISAIVHPPALLEALIFAPAGALLRFALSRALNLKHNEIPVGTLVANLLGSVTAAALSRSQSKWLLALTVGGAGSLSTTSTFVKEIEDSETKTKFLYASVSIASAIALCTSIFLLLKLTD